MSIPPTAHDIELLRRDKYDGNPDADMAQDLQRLAGGEPLAYVIGWIPFLGLRIELESKPLIPRPETEWWTEKLIAHLKYRFGDGSSATSEPFRLLDLCAGSGAIGLAVLSHFSNAYVSFGEVEAAHAEQIRINLELNHLSAEHTDIEVGDLFEPFHNQTFDIIVSNPPYVPTGRTLDASVTSYEPAGALFAGENGLEIIRRIATDAKKYMGPGGELWMECDIDNIAEAEMHLRAGGAQESAIHEDLYGRPRLLVGHFE